MRAPGFERDEAPVRLSPAVRARKALHSRHSIAFLLRLRPNKAQGCVPTKPRAAWGTTHGARLGARQAASQQSPGRLGARHKFRVGRGACAPLCIPLLGVFATLSGPANNHFYSISNQVENARMIGLVFQLLEFLSESRARRYDIA